MQVESCRLYTLQPTTLNLQLTKIMRVLWFKINFLKIVGNSHNSQLSTRNLQPSTRNLKVLFIIAGLVLLFPERGFSQAIIPEVKEKEQVLVTDGSRQFVHNRFLHNIGLEFRPAYIFPSAPFLQGYNNKRRSIGDSFSGHLKYSFSLPAGSLGSEVYSNTYQGVGLTYFDFKNSSELGRPVAVYLFQRSKIAKLGSSISLDYEWNFGLSGGWKPYDYINNPNNIIIGSKFNAYMNAGVFVRWNLVSKIDLVTGIDITHFSNGNTEFPNAGLNMTGLKTGLVYDFGKRNAVKESRLNDTIAIRFPRHISYDLVVFGSWRRKGVAFSQMQVPSPLKYPVIGAYFAPMYNLSYRVRTGFSLDAIYDGSANVYTEDYIIGAKQEFFKPDIDRQIALGVSGRAEYVMPVFTISIGVGANFLHKGGDLRGTYQSLALKVMATRSAFLHIGYNMKEFHDPNYLMLGLGYRFNNKTPRLLY